MTEILFYHLEQKPLEQVLPILLEKSLERDWNCVVQIGDASKLAALDKSLWTYSDESFLPHAPHSDEGDNHQPIILMTGEENPNAAHIRFFVLGAFPSGEGDYKRLVYMFDGHDPDAVSAARTAWTSLKGKHDITYWQQEPTGKWIKKA